MTQRRKPGEVRDAIRRYLTEKGGDATVREITAGVESLLQGEVVKSSVRSYLNLNEGDEFVRTGPGRYILKKRK